MRITDYFVQYFNKALPFIKKYQQTILIISVILIAATVFFKLSKKKESAGGGMGGGVGGGMGGGMRGGGSSGYKTSLEPDAVFNSQHFPPIKRFENVFSPGECKKIIEYGKGKLKRSLLGVHRKVGGDRTSTQAWVDPKIMPCMQRVSEYVAKLTGMPVENQEKFQLLNYLPGQQYKPHWDACNKTADDYEACLKEEDRRGWGKRVYTFFIYLNYVEEGGETHFPKLGLKVSPKPGLAVLWENLTADKSKAHPYSLHAGTPPKKGEKWAINVWVRERPEHNRKKGGKGGGGGGRGNQANGG